MFSRELGEHGALYFQPSWIGNSNLLDIAEDDYTVLAGIGGAHPRCPGHLPVCGGLPRVAGHDPGVTMISFGFEQRAGGHVFQLNFSNGFGTTLAQVARGGTANDDWYLASIFRGNFSDD